MRFRNHLIHRTLAVGGAAVGYLTNWIALKLIFEPVEKVYLGPIVLQGMFLKRQYEVSEEFADCMTEELLGSRSLWQNILSGSGSHQFSLLLRQRTQQLMNGAAAVLYGGARPIEFTCKQWWSGRASHATDRITDLLPEELNLVHPYVDTQLALRENLKENLRKLTPQEFEQVLHPVFQEDETTLILVGAVLGLIVGWGQAAYDSRQRRASTGRG